MPLVGRCLVALSLENMAQMATTIRAHDLRPLHSEGAISVSRHGTWYVVEVCWPSTARLELVVGFVQWSIASSAVVDAFFGHVLVVFAGAWGFGALLSDDAELLC